MLKITAIICTKNERENLPHSLPLLQHYFDEVLVVDSHSTDGTQNHATHHFTWNGHYPKKRQWILDHIPTRHDWVFMVDADEIITDDFVREVKNLDFRADGYFVRSAIVWKGNILKYGLKNNKLCLFHKAKFYYPIVDDLDMTGMGEMEGHYQPIPRNNAIIGQIITPILHHDRKGDWHTRHHKYALWEAAMNTHQAWPKDPVPWREFLKKRLRASRFRPALIFLWGFMIKCGFMDGRDGYDYACARAWYVAQIRRYQNGDDHAHALHDHEK